MTVINLKTIEDRLRAKGEAELNERCHKAADEIRNALVKAFPASRNYVCSDTEHKLSALMAIGFLSKKHFPATDTQCTVVIDRADEFIAKGIKSRVASKQVEILGLVEQLGVLLEWAEQGAGAEDA